MESVGSEGGRCWLEGEGWGSERGWGWGRDGLIIHNKERGLHMMSRCIGQSYKVVN